VTITATASAAAGIASVVFVDTTNPAAPVALGAGTPVTGSAADFSLTPPPLTLGPHTITATATDKVAAPNSASASLAITVQ
jgi:Bacterial Ig domain